MDDYTYDSYDYGGAGQGGFQGAPAAATPDTYDAYDYGGAGQGGFQPPDIATVMEGLSVAGISPDTWSWGGSMGDAQTTGDFTRADRAMPGVADSGGSTASKFASFLSSAGDFANKYKSPLEMLGRGIQASAKAGNDARVAQRQIDEKIAAQGRYSDSVKGLRKPGLIGQTQLKRLDGSPVYQGNGIINRGA